MNAVAVIVVVLAVSAPAWHLAARPLGLPVQRVAAAAAFYDVLAATVLVPIVTPDWSYLSMLAIAVPSGAAAVVSLVVLGRVAKREARE